jgi:transcriptional regulator with XRE-family HTH domain
VHSLNTCSIIEVIVMTHSDTRIQSPLDFGAQLLVARKSCGLTQRQAALRAGVSLRLWNEAEKGKRAQIGLETALRMLHAVGVELHLAAQVVAGTVSETRPPSNSRPESVQQARVV